ncbi:hypothetical protein AB4Y85_04930 [Microvirga sp. 2YAF29]|uniref:hypothetical protein n=1 Tax=Microvirga sp. 2YAF29 TaxID=3233031 RepID=UPI003F9A04E0
MTTAIFASAFAGSSEAPSKPAGLMRRILDAMIESRTRAAAIELRRHEAYIADLQRKQEHSPFFLMQDEALPFKV